jgi:ribosomal protein L19
LSLTYFEGVKLPDLTKIRRFIEKRRMRNRVQGMRKHYFITIGDVIKVVFYYKISFMGFTGICIAIRRKNFTEPEVGLIVRNVIVGVGVEIIVAYYYNRSYNSKFLDYRRKRFHVPRSRLYHVREKTNAVSKV